MASHDSTGEIKQSRNSNSDSDRNSNGTGSGISDFNGNDLNVVDISKKLEDKEQALQEEAAKFKPTPRFWAIIFTCAVIGLLSALENTVVTTALPNITADLDLGGNYIWVTNVFFLTGAAFQPFLGQLADIYGRRWVTMAIVVLFALGSGLSGGANSPSMLIGGRAVQGIGSGGLYIIIDIIVSDLVPLRVRGNYMAIILTIYTIGLAIGPWLGGFIVGRTTWRWVFYLTLPVSGVGIVMIYIFLRTGYNRSETHLQKLARIDYIGNTILVGSTVGILYATTYGGTTYSWGSARILTSLIIGFAGFVLFGFYERKAKEPVMPPKLFSNRTTVIIFFATFLNSALLYWTLFFLPVYFQVVLGASAAEAGVNILPGILFGLPGAIVAVLILSKWGEYKPLHVFGFGLAVVGTGLLVLLDRNSSTAEWVIFQMIQAIGAGMMLNTLLPAVQAQLPERHQAATTSAWAFVRSFGSIWGVAIPAAIFSNRFAQLDYRIEDPAVRELYRGGNRAYENAYASYLTQFDAATQSQIIGVYEQALKRVWEIAIVFAGINFIIVLFEQRVPLRTELETEYGLEERKKKNKDGDAAVDVEKVAASK